ncbi:hypothetical protein MEO40_25075, partial [Dolichospermum sp. ST_sed1]|nr:hypothetical protein [Dolichospermum sp. ST_sed1]
EIYEELVKEKHGPVLLIENKILYSQHLLNKIPEGYSLKKSNEPFFTMWMKPNSNYSDITLIGYGGITPLLTNLVDQLFEEHDLICQILTPTKLYPLEMKSYKEVLLTTRNVLIVEEGQGFCGFGAEIISQIVEMDLDNIFKLGRVFADDYCIPAQPMLEYELLPNKEKILAKIMEIINE